MTGFEDNENIQRGGAEGLRFNVCWQVDSRCVRGYRHRSDRQFACILYNHIFNALAQSGVIQNANHYTELTCPPRMWH